MTRPAGLAPGDPVRYLHTKYDGTRHWNGDMLWLGEDEFGRWLASPAGWPAYHGDRRVEFPMATAKLVPWAGWWSAAFNSRVPDRDIAIYADITTVAAWGTDHGVPTLTMTDLDLDVIQRYDGPLELADEDEFAEHATQLGYPTELRAGAEASARWLLDAVREGRGAFDPAVHGPWLAQVEAISPGPAPTR